MQAVDAVAAEVDQLVAGVFDAGLAQGGRVVLVFRQQLDDGRRQRAAAEEHHALDLRLPQKRHDAAGDGRGNARRFGRLTETVEVIVVEEQLGDEEVGAGILLRAQMADVLARVQAVDVSLGVGRRAHAQLRLLQARDELAGITEVGRLLAIHKVAAQGEHCFHVGGAQGLPQHRPPKHGWRSRR